MNPGKKPGNRGRSGKLEAVLLHIIKLLKTDITDYCDLETTHGGQTIVGQDGSLATVLRFNGAKSLMSQGAFEGFVDRFAESLAAFYKVPGYQLQVVFTRDMDVRPTLETIAQQQCATAERIGLALEDLIDEQIERYADYCYQEDCFLVFWTRPALVSSAEIKRFVEETNEFRKRVDWPVTRNAQNLLSPITYLIEQHATYVAKLAAELGSPQLGCNVEVLDVGEALRAIKKSVYPDEVGNDWQAAHPGTPIPQRWKTNDDPADKSELLYPPLPTQIMTTSAEIGRPGTLVPDPSTVRVGNRIFAPLNMLVPPQEPHYFNDLFNALNMVSTKDKGKNRAMPWSISFMLVSDGMSGLALRKHGSGLVFFSPTNNKSVHEALNALTFYENNGGCVVKLRLTAMTWSSDLTPEAIAELDLRKRQLKKALEGWGHPTISERSGNPMEAFQSCAVGLTTQHVGSPCPAPIDEAIRMLPLTRPASPFLRGSVIFRSLDGKALLYPRFSSEQTTWITLLAGRPGSGKSVTLNFLNLQGCLLPGIKRLPYLAIIDIGISSEGVINVIRDALPENMRHLAVYKRLQNSKEYSINVLDTPLGQRRPLPKDRQFMQNFVTMLVTPPERRGEAYEHMSSFAGRVIDKAFQMKQDNLEGAEPLLYYPHTSSLVDHALEEIGCHPPEIVSWWEIVDTLFKAGKIYEAEIAQRFAVPTLPDLSNAAMTLKDEYEGVKIGQNSIPIITAFTIGISETMGDFPMFAQHTQFDIGSARVIALDLQEVAQGVGSDADYKRISLMYMIARQSFMKKVAFAKEELEFISPLYRDYFSRIVLELIDEFKVLCADEFHRTGGLPILKRQFAQDGRESRKWQMEICLSSQMLNDFGDEMLDFATTTLVFSGASLDKLKNVTETEKIAYERHVVGPSPIGTTFLCRVQTNSGAYSQLFTLTLGAKTLWALSTTAEDRKLRSLLYDAMPGAQARAALAKHFPAGSCKRYVEEMRLRTSNTTTFVDDDARDEIVVNIASAIIDTEFGSDILKQRVA